MMLRTSAYGQSLFNTSGPFGGCAFGAVATPAPPDPNGWTKGSGALASVTWMDNPNPITGRPGWVRQMGYTYGMTRPVASTGQTEQLWILAYATTDGVTLNWYWKWAVSPPYYPAVSPLAKDTVTGGEGPSGSSQTTGSGGDARVTALQRALNLSGVGGGKLVTDGRIGPKTCEACYAFQKAMKLKQEPLLTTSFFSYLGLPESYAAGIGSVCTPYYTGPLPEGKQVSEEPVYTPPTTTTPAPAYEPAPPVEPPPVLEQVSQAGFPWWGGALAGLALIGGALWWRKRGKKRGRK
jgi:hypothetical protein